MKKQFRRAGALMLALLMLMTAAPALAEDAPSAADGTQIEEIIGEEPAVTEAPTAIPTEIPTEAPTNTPNPTGIPTEAPTETPILTEIPTEEPTNTPIPTEIPTETPTETPIPTDVPTEAPTATPDEDVFVPGLATLRSGAKLYANQQLTGDADVTEVSGTVYAEARADSKRAVRIAFYDGAIVRTAWVKTSSTEMLTDEIPSEQQPHYQRHQRYCHNHRHKHAGYPVCYLCNGGLCCRRIRNHFDYLRKRRILPHPCGAASYIPRLVYGRRRNAVPFRLVNRDALSRKGRFIYCAAALQHYSVNGNAFSRPHGKLLALKNLLRRHRYFFAVPYDSCRLRGKIHKAF